MGLGRASARVVDDRDSELVRQVKDETDLLKEISPSQNDLIEVAHSFEEVLETLGDRVAARYGQNQHGWEEDRSVYSAPWINTGFSYAPDYLTWVYCGAKGTKIGDALRHQLVGRELSLPHGSWLGMHPKLASIYLATLADAIARHNRISPRPTTPACTTRSEPWITWRSCSLAAVRRRRWTTRKTLSST